MNGLYEVSNLGRIKSVERIVKRNNNIYNWKEKILTPQIEKNGYIRFVLSKNGKMYRILAHRAVAETFIENYSNKPQVNHKDGNKLNNRVENLEWVSAQENTLHSLKNNLRKPQKVKKIAQFDKNMQFIKLWNSAKDIELELKVRTSHIYSCCNNKLKQAKGYIWKYENN